MTNTVLTAPHTVAAAFSARVPRSLAAMDELGLTGDHRSGIPA